MKKLLFLLALLPLALFGQQNLNNNTFRIDASGTVYNTGGQKLHVRHVYANDTLKKTDRFVCAYGDITLTLPSVGLADTGLTVTVKNCGTYTDLVVVNVYPGQNADDITQARLPRYQTRTIIVDSLGRWSTYEKGSRTDQVYDISATGSFTTIHQILAFLNEHMDAPTVIRLGGGDYTLTQPEVINLPYPLTLRGFSFGTTNITVTSALAGKTAFRALTDLTFENIQVTSKSTTADFVHFVGPKTYNEIRNFKADSFNIAILDSTDAEMWITETDISHCTTAGIKLHSANDSVRMRITTTDFIGCDKGIWLSKGDKAYIDIDGGCGLRNVSASDSAIVYVPATFTNILNGYIQGTKWNGIGVFISGFDFTRSDGRDANWYVQQNAGLEDKNPHGKLNGWTNTDTTTIATTGKYYKDQFDTTSSYKCKWTVGENRFTYQAKNPRDVWGNISMTASAGTNNTIVTYRIVKNNDPSNFYGQMAVFCKTAGEPVSFSFPYYAPNIKQGDYLELWVTANNATPITTSSVNWLIESK